MSLDLTFCCDYFSYIINVQTPWLCVHGTSAARLSRNDKIERKPDTLRRAGWAALVYLIAGFAWIAFSDTAAEAWFPDPQTLSLVQTWKGFLFVLTTGLVLFVVLLRQLTKDRALLTLQHNQRQALRKRERQLQVLMDNLPGMAYRCRYDPHWTMLFVSQGVPASLVMSRKI